MENLHAALFEDNGARETGILGWKELQVGTFGLLPVGMFSCRISCEDRREPTP